MREDDINDDNNPVACAINHRPPNNNIENDYSMAGWLAGAGGDVPLASAERRINFRLCRSASSCRVLLDFSATSRRRHLWQTQKFRQTFSDWRHLHVFIFVAIAASISRPLCEQHLLFSDEMLFDFGRSKS